MSHRTPGRGGTQHKYLQELIKRWAESKNWIATIEKPILDGLGSVDVALERDGISVACEIGSTTSIEHEVQNIQKCLAADFTYVCAVVLDDKRTARMITGLDASLERSSRENVHVFTAQTLLGFLDSISDSRVTANAVTLGYKVKTNRKNIGNSDSDARKRTVGQTILQALRRLKS